MTSKWILVICALLAFNAATAQDSLRICAIKISGNKKTQEWVILREMNVKMGDQLAHSDQKSIFEKDKKQLLNSGLFNEVEIQITGCQLIVTVREKWYFWPIPIIDLADRNFNQWWLSKDPKRLIYGTELKYENVRGRNEKLLANLTLGYTKQADVTYLIPVIKKRQNLGFAFNAAYLANKEVWYATDSNKVQFHNDVNEVGIKRFKASAGIIRRKGINQYQYYNLKWEHASTVDTIVQLNPNFFSNGNKQLSIFTLNYKFCVG